MIITRARWLGFGILVLLIAALTGDLVLSLSLYSAHMSIAAKDREYTALQKRTDKDRTSCAEADDRSARLRSEITRKNIELATERVKAEAAAQAAAKRLIAAEAKNDTTAKREAALHNQKRPDALTPCEHAAALIEGEMAHGPTHQ